MAQPTAKTSQLLTEPPSPPQHQSQIFFVVQKRVYSTIPKCIPSDSDSFIAGFRRMWEGVEDVEQKGKMFDEE
eukprot:11227157-Ditylum_brightwellii.AAC.1